MYSFQIMGDANEVPTTVIIKDAIAIVELTNAVLDTQINENGGMIFIVQNLHLYLLTI